MDPASILGIVTATGSLMTAASKAALGCKSLSTKYGEAPATLAHLEDECRQTRNVLSYVHDFLMSHSDSVSRRLCEPGNPFSRLVHDGMTSCTQIFGGVQGQAQSMLAAWPAAEDDKARQRIRVMWNEESMSQSLGQMKNVESHLHLLLTVLQTLVFPPN